MNSPTNHLAVRRRLSQAGFTMIEIMLVVMIIVLLLGFAISQIGGNIVIARETKAKGDIQTISTQLMIYQTLNNTLPSTQQGLQALVTKPASEPKARGWRQLLKEMPTDPFNGKEYLYAEPGTHNPDSYDLASVGPDKKPNTDDDIGNWKRKD